GNDSQLHFPFNSRPRATGPPAITHPLPGAELRDAFVGTPVTKSSWKHSRLLDLVVRPVPSCSPAQGGSWHSPCRTSTSFMASSPLRSDMHGSVSQKNFLGASELNLLETPVVVKRAKVLATSASGVPGFTPRSVLRSSLRTTPLATPSASPGRSHHHRGVVEDAWSESRAKPTLLTLSNPEDDRAETEESSESIPGDGLEKMDVSKENSNISARSDQTTLEYHDAK
ncbi:ELYS protein, partial [Chroicocephalus maculipennis]|nr:ELYS protein [Chroicocephalus maculipennis]